MNVEQRWLMLGLSVVFLYIVSMLFCLLVSRHVLLYFGAVRPVWLMSYCSCPLQLREAIAAALFVSLPLAPLDMSALSLRLFLFHLYLALGLRCVLRLELQLWATPPSRFSSRLHVTCLKPALLKFLCFFTLARCLVPLPLTRSRLSL